jgi:hypothetical protein
MAVDNSTKNVSISGANGTDFNIDVTDCNLLQDTTIQDFVGFVDGNQQSDSNFEKLDQTTVKYVGPSLSNASVSIRRVTPPQRVQEISFGSRFSSALWEAELNRSSRRAYEYELNGTPGGASFSAPSIQDDAFSSSWDGNTSDGASKNALYDIISTKADIKDETFKGKPKLNSQPAAGLSNNRLVTAGWCQDEFLDKNESDNYYLNEASNLADIDSPPDGVQNLGIATQISSVTKDSRQTISVGSSGTYRGTITYETTDELNRSDGFNNNEVSASGKGVYLVNAMQDFNYDEANSNGGLTTIIIKQNDGSGYYPTVRGTTALPVAAESNIIFANAQKILILQSQSKVKIEYYINVNAASEVYLSSGARSSLFQVMKLAPLP